MWWALWGGYDQGFLAGLLKQASHAAGNVLYLDSKSDGQPNKSALVI